jgi:hypothetical protein
VGDEIRALLERVLGAAYGDRGNVILQNILRWREPWAAAGTRGAVCAFCAADVPDDGVLMALVRCPRRCNPHFVRVRPIDFVRTREMLIKREQKVEALICERCLAGYWDRFNDETSGERSLDPSMLRAECERALSALEPERAGAALEAIERRRASSCGTREARPGRCFLCDRADDRIVHASRAEVCWECLVRAEEELRRWRAGHDET